MPKRSLTVSCLALLFGGLATVAPSPAATAAAPSAVAPQGALSLDTTTLDVTTTTGRHLSLMLSAAHGFLAVDMWEDDGTAYNEDHAWTFDVSPVLQFDRNEGTGRIHLSSSDLHGYGRLDLRLRQTRSWASQDCRRGSASTTRVRIKGNLVFHTRASGDQPWGNVGTSTEPLEIDTHGRMTADDGCRPPNAPFTMPCAEAISWAQGELFGGSFTFDDVEQHLLAAFDLKFLPHTSGEGLRFDSYLVDVAAPVLTQTETGVQVDVAGSTDGRVTGTATLTAEGAGTPSSFDCDGGTMTVTDWDNATLVNGEDPLTLHPDLGPAVVAHAGTGGAIEHATPDEPPTVAHA